MTASGGDVQRTIVMSFKPASSRAGTTFTARFARGGTWSKRRASRPRIQTSPNSGTRARTDSGRRKTWALGPSAKSGGSARRDLTTSGGLGSESASSFHRARFAEGAFSPQRMPSRHWERRPSRYGTRPRTGIRRPRTHRCAGHSRHGGVVPRGPITNGNKRPTLSGRNGFAAPSARTDESPSRIVSQRWPHASRANGIQPATARSPHET